MGDAARGIAEGWQIVSQGRFQGKQTLASKFDFDLKKGEFNLKIN